MTPPDGAVAGTVGDAPPRPPTLWIDVQDLYEYASKNARPSGIQRLAYELCLALTRLPAARTGIRFLRHDSTRAGFSCVPWEEVAAVYADLSARPPPLPPQTLGDPHTSQRRAVRRLTAWIAGDIRMPLRRITIGQIRSAGAMRRMVKGVIAASRHALSGTGQVAARRAEFTAHVRPGDVILALGAMWFHPGYADLLETMRAAHRVRFALLVYDLIPLRRPEWCEPGLIRLFREYIETTLPLADLIFTISRASAADIHRQAAACGMTLRAPPTVLPIGAGFTRPSGAGVAPPADAARPRPIPEAGYALIVATIEARKNHALLFRVWRRLLDERPAATIPPLVMAGHRGWLVQDLFAQMQSCDFLGGKIIVFEDPTDEELAALYAGCAFTLFPSFYEGWGLPVTESLAMGKPCLAASATSLPEAGGALARYFDPYDESDALAAVRRVIDDPQDLRAWQDRVRADYQPVSWDMTAEALIAAITRERVGTVQAGAGFGGS